jgi:hypothetical protein
MILQIEKYCGRARARVLPFLYAALCVGRSGGPALEVAAAAVTPEIAGRTNAVVGWHDHMWPVIGTACTVIAAMKAGAAAAGGIGRAAEARDRAGNDSDSEKILHASFPSSWTRAGLCFAKPRRAPSYVARFAMRNPCDMSTRRAQS